MKIITIAKEEFDSFARNHKYRSFYQSSAYGDLMSQFGFSSHYMGFVNNSNELVGATLLLYRDLIMGFKYAYAPRGFLIDYTDADFVIELTEKLKKLLFKQKYIYIKIDPPIHCSERDNEGTIISYNPEINQVLEILKKAHYQHHGFNQYFENTKPRWNAVVRLTSSNSKMFEQFSKPVRNKIRKAIRKGVEIYQGTDEEISIFFDFIKKKHRRPLKYYQELSKLFGSENVEFFFAKINTEKYVINVKTQYEKELSRNDELNAAVQSYRGFSRKNILNKKMDSDKLVNTYKLELVEATKLLSDYPEGLTIASACIIKYEKGIYLLIDGYQDKYGKFNPGYLLKWEIMKHYNKKEYQFFNLNAITGEFSNKNKLRGLNDAKLGFHASVVEYIGEFDYIINYPLYKICRWAPIRKYINKKAA